MKLIMIIMLFLASSGASAVELSEDPNQLLQQLVTCDIKQEDIMDNYDVSDAVGSFFRANLIPEKKRRPRFFLPKNELRVFGLDVVKVFQRVGLSPGFMVELDTTVSKLLEVVVIDGDKMIEECNDKKTMCGMKISETEKLLVVNERGRVFLACSYPYQK